MPTKYASQDAWLRKGEALFGRDYLKWRFQCPACKRVQTPEQFRPYGPKGARPDSAAQECIGRYMDGKAGPMRCDWAAFGLFRGPDIVVMDGKDVGVFPFDAPPVEAGQHAKD